MKNKMFLTGLISLFSCLGFSQKNNLWLTYGQSKFLYSPGLEFNYFLKKKIGIQVGICTYFQDYDENKIVNYKDFNSFNFHNANLGLCTNVLTKKEHRFGVELGFKVYYGAEFEILNYYKKGGYNIYYDSSELRPAYGIDLGLFYSFKKVTGLLKFDSARQKMRIGIGYLFGGNQEEN